MKRLVMAALIALMFAAPAFSEERKFPTLSDGQVIMEWKDFEKILRELLKPEVGDTVKPPPTPPVAYSIRSASFEVSIDDKVGRVRADYAVDVLVDDKWVEVRVGGSGSGVHEVLVDGEPALIAEKNGVINALLLGKASHKITVSHAVAAPANPGPNSFSVGVAPVAGSVVSLRAPKELSELSITGAVVTESSEDGDRKLIRAVSGRLDWLRVNYTVPAPAAELPDGVEPEEIKPKLYSAQEVLVSVSDEVVRASATFNFDIKQAALSQFEIETPKGYEVVDVSGQGITDRWRVAEGRLIAPVSYEVKGPYRLTVLMELKREESSGEFPIPSPRTMEVERESGFIAIETKDALEIGVGELEGLAPIDSTEAPNSLQRRARYPILHAMRFSKHPFSGTVTVIKHEDVDVLTATIDSINLVTLITHDGKAVTRVIYEIRNNKKQYIKIDLPGLTLDGEGGPKVWSASLDGEAVKPTINKDKKILLPLKKSSGGKVSCEVELIYIESIDKMEKKGGLGAVFPKADIPASEMLVTMYLPPGFEYSDFEGDLEEEEDIIVSEPMAGEKPAGPADMRYDQREGWAGKLRKKGLSSGRSQKRQMQMEQEIVDQIQSKNEVQGYDADPGVDRNTLIAIDGDLPVDPARADARLRSGTYRVPNLSDSTLGADFTKPAGFLPVQFNVPLRGEKRRFVKLLVMDEAPELSFKYEKLPEKPFNWRLFWRIVKITIAGLAVFLLIILIVRVIRSDRRGREERG